MITRLEKINAELRAFIKENLDVLFRKTTGRSKTIIVNALKSKYQLGAKELDPERLSDPFSLYESYQYLIEPYEKLQEKDAQTREN